MEVLGQLDMYIALGFLHFSPAYLESLLFWYDLKGLFPVQKLG